MPTSATKAQPTEELYAEHPFSSRHAERPALRTRTPKYIIFKRCFDIPASLLLIALALPLFLAIALIIRLTSRGPVIFAHRRLGRNGVFFPCLKFRTMRPDAEDLLRHDKALWEEYVANDYKLPAGRDPRITPIGRLLRRTSLDELPQVFNVLRGEMSLVGPRPIVAEEIAEYGDLKRDFLSALPGITGNWQVMGRSALSYPERAHRELQYIYEWSPLLDLKILYQTVGVVLQGHHAH